MDWIPEFYDRQDEWTGIYTGPVREHHRAKVALLGERRRLRVLELGAGGGQHAAATADLGHDVTAIELVPRLAANAADLAARPRKGTLGVYEGDFYTIDVPGSFDVVCYWDGFGVGTDDDQRRLLKRIREWLKPNGEALIDVYTPWHAASTVGAQQEWGGARRRYDFDAEGCRWLDTWWPVDDEREAVTQSLRCYSPADLRLLLSGSGLILSTILPGDTPLHRAVFYTARLTKESPKGDNSH